jgi:hypothetical protein
VLIGNLSPKVEIPLQEVVSREISVIVRPMVKSRVSICSLAALSTSIPISLKRRSTMRPGCSSGHDGDKRLMK